MSSSEEMREAFSRATCPKCEEKMTAKPNSEERAIDRRPRPRSGCRSIFRSVAKMSPFSGHEVAQLLQNNWEGATDRSLTINAFLCPRPHRRSDATEHGTAAEMPAGLMAWLPEVYSQIFRSYGFGPSVFWTMAPLHYAAKFDPLGLSPRPPPRRNPRKGRDQILPSGNTAQALFHPA